MAAAGNFEKVHSVVGKGRGPHHDGDPLGGSGVPHPGGASRLPGVKPRSLARKVVARKVSKKRKSAKRA